MIATGLFTTQEGWELTYGARGGDRSRECCGLFYGCGFNLLLANLALVGAVLAWVGGASVILFYTIDVSLVMTHKYPLPCVLLLMYRTPSLRVFTEELYEDDRRRGGVATSTRADAPLLFVSRIIEHSWNHDEAEKSASHQLRRYEK